MLLKDRVLTTIKEQLPSEFTMDDLFERMSFIESVEQGLRDSDKEQTLTEEELDKEMIEWFK